MGDDKSIDRAKLAALRTREEAAFRALIPASLAHLERARRHMPDAVPMAWMAGLYPHPPMVVESGEDAHFWDLDGNRYLDMNQADLSASCGFTPEPVIRAVTDRMTTGAQFLLPTEDALAVSSLLAERFGLPAWQFTLSASTANSEAIRLARLVTGREKILIFGGRYHGMLDDTLVTPEEAPNPLLYGLPSQAGRETKLVDFNDLAAAEEALAAGDVACAITEPALTNCGVVPPEAGFLEGLYDLTQAHGTLLLLDEAHTHMSAYGGLKREWGLKSDMVSLGKSLGGGVPIGAYGMTETLAKEIESNRLGDFAETSDGLAIGGTMAGSALALAAARATLEEVLTEDAYDRVAGLGLRLADGLDGLFAKHELPWKAHRLGGRSGFCLRPDWPKNYREAQDSMDLELIATRKIYLANRGIWDAIATAGPAASFAHQEADIDHYLAVIESFLQEIT